MYKQIMKKRKSTLCLEEIVKILENHKEKLKNNFGVARIGVFGSCVRNERDKKSDIDVLVDLEKSMGFFKFLQLERYLSDVLGGKVDLVTRNALKPYIGKRILNEVIYV